MGFAPHKWQPAAQASAAARNQVPLARLNAQTERGSARWLAAGQGEEPQPPASPRRRWWRARRLPLSVKHFPVAAQLDGRSGWGICLTVVLGGSFCDPPSRCRGGCRWRYPAWQRVFNVGFRVACEGD